MSWLGSSARSAAFWTSAVVAAALAIPVLYSYLDRNDSSFLASPNVSWWTQSEDSQYLNYHGTAVFTRFQSKKRAKQTHSQQDLAGKDDSDDPERILLFLHGFPTMSMDFADYFGDESQRPAHPMAFQSNVSLTDYRRYFSAHFHALTFDFMGFGLSDKNIGANVTVQAQTDLTQFILNHFVQKIQNNLEKADNTRGSRFTTQKNSATKGEVQEYEMKNAAHTQEYHRRKGAGAAAVEIAIVAHDYGVSIAQELIARQMERVSLTAGADVPPSADAAVNYKISSVVFLNGGLFPETHRARLIQRLLITPVISTVLTFLNNELLFRRSFTAILGSSSPISQSFLRESWQAIEYKGGRNIVPELQKYIWQRQQHRERWVKALHDAFGSVRDSGSVVGGKSAISIKLVNGPADPVSGRHMVERFIEIYGADKAEIKLLDDRVGHYPQVEDAQTVMHEIQIFYQQIYDNVR